MTCYRDILQKQMIGYQLSQCGYKSNGRDVISNLLSLGGKDIVFETFTTLSRSLLNANERTMSPLTYSERISKEDIGGIVKKTRT